MHMHRRVQRALALTCTATALAAAPATAVAMPALDEPPAPAADHQPDAAPTIVRVIETGGGDQTLALVISGAALLVALGGAGYAGRRVHRFGQPSH